MTRLLVRLLDALANVGFKASAYLLDCRYRLEPPPPVPVDDPLVQRIVAACCGPEFTPSTADCRAALVAEQVDRPVYHVTPQASREGRSIYMIEAFARPETRRRQ